MHKVTKLIRTYISGPIRRCQMEERQRCFEEAELMILNRNEVPVNPLKNGLDINVCDHMHMAIDLGLIRTCNKIVMLPYWQESQGAREEYEYAVNLGLEVEYISKVNVPNPYMLGKYNPFDPDCSNFL